MRWLVMFFLIPFSALAQDATGVAHQDFKFDYYLHQFSAANTDGQSSVSLSEFRTFIQKFEAKQSSFKSDRDFLKHLFVKTHQKFLVKYTNTASFQELFKSGNYNCLTGTALYALMLDHFKVDYRIVETNYHIFILVQTKAGQILLETTDPTHGFVDKSDLVTERINLYRRNELPTASAEKTYYRYGFELFNEVNLDQLLGLLYYNLSTVDYNNQMISAAIVHLDKAMELYPSPRMDEFSKILLLTIHESGLDRAEKENLIKSIQSMRRRKMVTLISAKAF